MDTDGQDKCDSFQLCISVYTCSHLEVDSIRTKALVRVSCSNIFCYLFLHGISSPSQIQLDTALHLHVPLPSAEIHGMTYLPADSTHMLGFYLPADIHMLNCYLPASIHYQK